MTRWRWGVVIAGVAIAQGCGVPSERPIPFGGVHEGVPFASWYQAEPVASATYAAVLGVPDFGGDPAQRMPFERGAYRCGAAGTGHPFPGEEPCSGACPFEVQQALQQASPPALFVIDDAGPRVVPMYQLPAYLAPIDSPAKAVLVVYGLVVQKGRGLEMTTGAAQVRAVDGGFEVFTSAEESALECGTGHDHGTMSYYDLVLFVRRDGAVEDRDRRLVARHEIVDPCHQL